MDITVMEREKEGEFTRILSYFFWGDFLFFFLAREREGREEEERKREGGRDEVCLWRL